MGGDGWREPLAPLADALISLGGELVSLGGDQPSCPNFAFCFVILNQRLGFQVTLGGALDWPCFFMSNGVEIMSKYGLEVHFW